MTDHRYSIEPAETEQDKLVALCLKGDVRQTDASKPLCFIYQQSAGSDPECE